MRDGGGPRPVTSPVAFRRWRLTLLAVALSFGLRVFYAFEYTPRERFREWAPTGDSVDYLLIAHTLNQTAEFGRLRGVAPQGLFSQAPLTPSPGQVVDPDGWRPPLWPALLAVILRLANYQPAAILVCRFLIDAVSVVLLSRFLSLLDAPLRAHTIALLLFAVHPAGLIYAPTLLSESVAIPFHILVATLLWLLPRVKRRIACATAAGAAAGFSLLVHPYFMLMPAIAVLAMYRAKLVDMRQLAATALGCAVVVCPWVARNMATFHTWRPFLSTSQGTNLAKGWNSAFLASYDNSTTEIQLDEYTDVAAASIAHLGAVERSEVLTATALRFVRHNWRLVPAILTRKLVGAITPVPEKARAGLLEAGRAIFASVAFLPLLFAFTSKPHPLHSTAVAMVGAYLAMSVLTFSTIRYRFPLIWVEMAAIGYAVDAIGRAPWRQRSRAAIGH